MTEQKWTVYWGENAADTYLYGSKVQLRSKADVLFENRLMPPGTIIKRWYSKTNYQRHRIEPSLPIIDGETEYEISANIEYPEGGSCIIRLEFFDKFEEKAGFFVLHDQPARFRCPLKTYSFEMQLMSAGTGVFRFHSVTIKEVGGDDETR